MAIYRYRAINAKGEMVTGYICGTNGDEIRQTIAGHALDLVSLYRHWGVHVSQKNRELFFTHLGYYLKAGYRVSQALSLTQESFSGSFKKIISSLHTKLVEGVLLSEACESYPMIFTPPTIALMKAGEHSGQFVHACYQCALYVAQLHQNKEKILKAASYPLLSFCFFLCSFCILVHTLLPNILALCADLGHSPSWATHLLYSLNQPFFWKVSLVVFLLITMGLSYWPGMVFKIAGKFIARPIYAQFFSIVALLMKENVLLVEALQIACDTMYYRPLKPFFNRLIQEIKKGKNLSQSLEHFPHFPTLYVQLIRSGDHTAHQLQAITAVSGLMNQAMDQFYERLAFWISPLFMICVAMCFWVLIEGTFIPLYTSVNGFFYGR